MMHNPRKVCTAQVPKASRVDLDGLGCPIWGSGSMSIGQYRALRRLSAQGRGRLSIHLATLGHSRVPQDHVPAARHPHLLTSSSLCHHKSQAVSNSAGKAYVLAEPPSRRLSPEHSLSSLKDAGYHDFLENTSGKICQGLMLLANVLRRRM